MKRIIRWVDDHSTLAFGKVKYGIGKNISDVIPENVLTPKRLDDLIDAGKIRIEFLPESGADKKAESVNLPDGLQATEPAKRGRKPKASLLDDEDAQEPQETGDFE